MTPPSEGDRSQEAHRLPPGRRKIRSHDVKRLSSPTCRTLERSATRRVVTGIAGRTACAAGGSHGTSIPKPGHEEPTQRGLDRSTADPHLVEHDRGSLGRARGRDGRAARLPHGGRGRPGAHRPRGRRAGHRQDPLRRGGDRRSAGSRLRGRRGDLRSLRRHRGVLALAPGASRPHHARRDGAPPADGAVHARRRGRGYRVVRPTGARRPTSGGSGCSTRRRGRWSAGRAGTRSSSSSRTSTGSIGLRSSCSSSWRRISGAPPSSSSRPIATSTSSPTTRCTPRWPRSPGIRTPSGSCCAASDTRPSRAS